MNGSLFDFDFDREIAAGAAVEDPSGSHQSLSESYSHALHLIHSNPAGQQ